MLGYVNHTQSGGLIMILIIINFYHLHCKTVNNTDAL